MVKALIVYQMKTISKREKPWNPYKSSQMLCLPWVQSSAPVFCFKSAAGKSVTGKSDSE